MLKATKNLVKQFFGVGNFPGSNFPGGHFSGGIFPRAYFRGSIFQGAFFRGAFFPEAFFRTPYIRYQEYVSLYQLRNNKLHFAFLYSQLQRQLTFVYLTSYRSKPFAVAKKRSRKKLALNSPAKRRLKNYWKNATLLKVSFIIDIFQGL